MLNKQERHQTIIEDWNKDTQSTLTHKEEREPIKMKAESRIARRERRLV